MITPRKHIKEKTKIEEEKKEEKWCSVDICFFTRLIYDIYGLISY